jgi:hypothetical protein
VTGNREVKKIAVVYECKRAAKANWFGIKCNNVLNFTHLLLPIINLIFIFSRLETRRNYNTSITSAVTIKLSSKDS